MEKGGHGLSISQGLTQANLSSVLPLNSLKSNQHGCWAMLLPSFRHSHMCPALWRLSHVRWQHQSPHHFEQPPLRFLVLDPCLLVIFASTATASRSCLPTPCLVCFMSFVAFGLRTGLIGELGGCSYKSLSCDWCCGCPIRHLC